MERPARALGGAATVTDFLSCCRRRHRPVVTGDALHRGDEPGIEFGIVQGMVVESLVHVSSLRIASMPRRRWDLAVPSGRSIAAATSGSVMPAK